MRTIPRETTNTKKRFSPGMVGFAKAEAEVTAMKMSIVAEMNKERERRQMDNREFSHLLEIPLGRWSRVLHCPQQMQVDYLLMLAAMCGVKFRMVRQ